MSRPLAWARGYRREDLPGDLTAGVTVAVMLVPQGMAYAMLAGLPPVVGLYASTFPLLAYALFGTSRQLAVGPAALDSLLVAAGVGAMAAAGTTEYVVLAGLLAAMVAALQITMGLTKLGRLAALLQHPVIAGFTSAAALVIAASQLPHLLGVAAPRASHFHEQLLALVSSIGDTSLPTLALGAGAIAVLIGLKRRAPRVPGALIVVALGALATWALSLDARGVAIVGDVPAGLPSLSFPSGVGVASVVELAPSAVVIALIGFVEALSVGKAYARKNGYEVDPNRELIGVGAANLVSAAVGGYAVTGGLGRTAVNAQAGARTPLAGVVTGGLVALALAFFTPLFHDLPKAVLAAIVVMAVMGLVDVASLRAMWPQRRAEAAVLIATFVVTLFVGIVPGLAAGVALSLARRLWSGQSLRQAVLGPA